MPGVLIGDLAMSLQVRGAGQPSGSCQQWRVSLVFPSGELWVGAASPVFAKRLSLLKAVFSRLRLPTACKPCTYRAKSNPSTCKHTKKAALLEYLVLIKSS